MRELTVPQDILAAVHGEPMLAWAAQGGLRGARVWVHGDAVAAAAPQISRRDRIVARGSLEHVAHLVCEVLRERGPSYRLFGPVEQVEAVAALLDMPVLGRFSWFDTRTPPPPQPGEDAVVPVGDEEVSALLAEAAPGSWAAPGVPGVQRWLGIRDAGVAVSVACEAWSAPTVGFVAGVGTAVDHRGRGLARAVCAVLVRELVEQRG
ncbi:hypothetical protein EV189_3018 [Motilibacter rhizosphaerae]|uniref:N-acetyltransferase domain-containing protein n=1 Tax=Motilibacter rhizosphaerae TaxID=598652 RepID=A0A4Q7NRB9_9ACTN|nr:GNAT family N-acetyltransferase [Motilibacter rhizosphaerae]RZS87586.1 hypothetical protein EV189_3018 [Motilibacter rhizosphaerae]